jgi:hypothetical protein
MEECVNRNQKVLNYNKIKYKYCRTALIRMLAIWTVLAIRVNLSGILRNLLALKLPVSDQVRYSVMASRTSNQAWSKSLGAGTYWK